MLIGLVGKARSGKDTVATSMVAVLRERVKTFSFADPLKEFCMQVFGWNRETIFGTSDLRNRPDPRYRRPNGELLTPRFALQTLGTEWGRNCYENIWADLGVRRAQDWLEAYRNCDCYDACDCSAPRIAVLTDCRFVNEAKAVRDAGGLVWKIERPGAGLSGPSGCHPSELELESPEMAALVTHTITNDSSLEVLRSRVLAILAAHRRLDTETAARHGGRS
jgi:hypothetical protein